jgi:hypothetical protein
VQIVEELAAKLGLEIDEGAFEKAAEALEHLKLGFGAVAGIAAAVGGALTAIVHSTAESAVAAEKAAQRTGVTASTYQELAFAAEQSGLDVGTLEHAMILMSRTAFGAAEGSKELAFTFRQLGVGIYDSHGKIKPTDALLGDLAERFSSMPDGVRKTALATQAFGRSGAELLPFLNKGRAGIQELRDAAYDYGVVIDEDAIAAAKRWEEQQKHLVAALKGLKTAIGVGLLKQIGDLTEKIAQWIRAHRELIAGGVLTFVAKLRQLVEPLIKIVDEIFIKTDAWKYSLLALTGVLALMNLPLLAIIGALLLIEDFYGFIEGKDSLIGTLFGDDKTRQSIRDFIHEVKAFFTWLMEGHIGNALGALVGGEGLGEAFKALGFKQGGGFSDLLKSGAVETPPGYTDFGSGVPSIPLVGPTPSASSRSVNVTQHIHAAPGMDEKQIADHSAQRIDEVLQKTNREAYSAIDQ